MGAPHLCVELVERFFRGSRELCPPFLAPLFGAAVVILVFLFLLLALALARGAGRILAACGTVEKVPHRRVFLGLRSLLVGPPLGLRWGKSNARGVKGEKIGATHTAKRQMSPPG